MQWLYEVDPNESWSGAADAAAKGGDVTVLAFLVAQVMLLFDLLLRLIPSLNGDTHVESSCIISATAFTQCSVIEAFVRDC